MKRRSIVQLALLLPLSLTTSLAWAGTATDWVKSRQTELFELLRKGDAASKKRIAAIFDEVLDYQALAEGSLEGEWSKLTDAQKKEFSELLKQLVTAAYEKNLKKTLDFNIEYLGDEKSGNTYLVKTRAKHKTDAREEPIAINYKLVEKDGKFRIVDLVPEEVSLVSSYRSQFVKIIKKDGFPALIKKMKDKIAKGDG